MTIYRYLGYSKKQLLLDNIASHIGGPELQPHTQQINNHCNYVPGALQATKSIFHNALPSFTFTPSPEPSVRDTTLIVALLDALDKWSWDVGLESLEIVWCDLLGEAQCSQDDVLIGVLEEAVGGSDGARVFVAESS